MTELGVIEVVTIVGKDGRITIPVRIREQLQINEGDVLKIVADGEEARITVITK